MRKALVVLLAALAIVATGTAASASTSPTDTIRQNLVVQQPARSCGNVLMVTDLNYAPMFGTNCASTWSGGVPFCVLKTLVPGGPLVDDICLGGPQRIYPSGTSVPASVTVYRDGRIWATLDGPQIAALSSLSPHQIRWLGRWLRQRGVR
jgi:hypothetical protein